MSGGFTQRGHGKGWFKRVDDDRRVRYFPLSDMGRRGYILEMEDGAFSVRQGNIDSELRYLHVRLPLHDTLEGAQAALLITLAALT